MVKFIYSLTYSMLFGKIAKMRKPELLFQNPDRFESRQNETEPHRCIFCDVIEGRRPSSIVARGKYTEAFMDLSGYPLITTRGHVVNMLDENLDDDTMRELGSMLRKLCRVVKTVYMTDSITILSNNGHDSGQEIDHLHFHVIPRLKGDGKVIARRMPPLSRETLDLRAGQIKEGLAQMKRKSPRK